MKRDLVFNLEEDEQEYLRKVKETMIELEEEESGIFGDEDRWLYYHTFNNLEDWQKNLLILYSKYRSYTKVADRLNVQKSTTAIVVKEITDKFNYIIKYDKSIDID